MTAGACYHRFDSIYAGRAMVPGDRLNVVIAGGGVAALEAALALRALAGDRVGVELFAPETHFWYRPLSVAEPFKLGEARHFDIAQLAAEAGAVFSPGELESVDAARRQQPKHGDDGSHRSLAGGPQPASRSGQRPGDRITPP